MDQSEFAANFEACKKEAPGVSQGLSFSRRSWLYPHTSRISDVGIVCKRKKVSINQPPMLKEKKRGKISTFSSASAKRMREFIILNHCPAPLIMEGSLTIPGEISVEEWFQSWKRFRMRLSYYKIPIIWRVELQKRGQPHIHCIAYCKEDQARWLHDFNSWISCLPERCRNHPHAKDRAARWYCVKEEQKEWLSYTTGHASKHKKDQLGWKGKQWGIICRNLFQPRAFQEIEISAEDHLFVLRNLRKYLKRKSKKKNPKIFLSASLCRIMDSDIFLRLLEFRRAGRKTFRLRKKKSLSDE